MNWQISSDWHNFRRLKAGSQKWKIARMRLQSYLEIVCLGNESARGGVIIDQLVGIAIEAIGVDSCKNRRPTERENLPRNCYHVGNLWIHKGKLGPKSCNRNAIGPGGLSRGCEMN